MPVAIKLGLLVFISLLGLILVALHFIYKDWSNPCHIPPRPQTVIRALKALKLAGCPFPQYYLRHMAIRPSWAKELADEYDKRIKNGSWKEK